MNISSKSMKRRKSLAVNEDSVREAYEILQKYKAGKASLEARIIENEEWWRMRHYGKSDGDCVPSAWLFNSVINKHADAMDSLPDVTCLAREESDRDAARLLTEVVPVILEQNRFDATYSDCWYDKLKSGTACYGVFWNCALDGGAGNVDVRRVDILNLFWEPGVSDLQHSKNIFHVELCDNSVLADKYPDLADSLSSPGFDTSKYIYDDAVDTSDKSCVVDWYYKKQNGGRTVLHFAKFCNGVLLYASENDEDCKERGFYDHGMYPFFIDRMYPVQGSPCGFGVIDAMKGTQAQIDALGDSVVRNARMAATRRFFVRSDGSLNEEEFADWRRPFVHYMGSGDPSSSIMPIELPHLSDTYVAILNNKIDELKETSGNRDFSQGTVSGGVTAAAAIEALQEAGSKTSRDILSSSYRTFEDICATVIKLVRQFYTVPRCFRITGEAGGEEFIYCGTEDLSTQYGGEPVFDIKVRAHKKSAFSRASMNELACELYKMGIFAPENSESAQLCLEMMEFEGRDEILRRIKDNEARGAAL
ncbi:MAG: hypothetical protein ACI3YE_03880 [Candidatus Avispirillum sp.]